MTITGNETIGVFECAKIVVNNQNQQLSSILVLGGILLLIYLWLIYQLMIEKQMKKFMKKKNIYDEYLLWREHRND